MPSLELLIIIGGITHFGILTASALVPFVLDWRTELGKLSPMLRSLVWVYGAFIVLTIVGFGTISLMFADSLADGSGLSRGVCAFIAVFWFARLMVQFFVFDTKEYLTNWFFKLGEHGLTVVFVYHSVIYAWAAFFPHSI